MDQALLSNIERGQRWPSEKCAGALAGVFKIPDAEFRARLVAARLWGDYGVNDPVMAARVAAHVNEAAANYGVNKPANKRAKKK